MSYPKHEDDRGYFQELLRGEDLLKDLNVKDFLKSLMIENYLVEESLNKIVEANKTEPETHKIKQISIFSIKKGKVRGQHYHESLKKELFLVLDGGTIYHNYTRPFPHQASPIKLITSKYMKAGQYDAAFEKEEHSFFTPDSDVLVLVLSTAQFDPNHPDVYRYD